MRKMLVMSGYGDTITVLQAGKERIFTTLQMKEPDRVPVFPINHYFSVTEGKMTIREFSRSGEKMAAAVLAAYERFGWDGIQLGCDVAVEGEALGGTAGFPDYSPPHIDKFVLDDPEKLKNLKIPNPLFFKLLYDFIKNS